MEKQDDRGKDCSRANSFKDMVRPRDVITKNGGKQVLKIAQGGKQKEHMTMRNRLPKWFG